MQSTWLAKLWRPPFLFFEWMIEQKPCPLRPTRGGEKSSAKPGNMPLPFQLAQSVTESIGFWKAKDPSCWSANSGPLPATPFQTSVVQATALLRIACSCLGSQAANKNHPRTPAVSRASFSSFKLIIKFVSVERFALRKGKKQEGLWADHLRMNEVSQRCERPEKTEKFSCEHC